LDKNKHLYTFFRLPLYRRVNEKQNNCNHLYFIRSPIYFYPIRQIYKKMNKTKKRATKSLIAGQAGLAAHIIALGFTPAAPIAIVATSCALYYRRKRRDEKANVPEPISTPRKLKKEIKRYEETTLRYGAATEEAINYLNAQSPYEISKIGKIEVIPERDRRVLGIPFGKTELEVRVHKK
jgi:hypothetical protein